MKNKFHLIAFLSLIISMSFTSCGPSKKLMVSRAKVENLQKDSTNTHSQLNDCNAQVKNLNEEKAALQKENASVQNDLKALSTESKMTIADQAKRLKDLQNMIQ